MPQFQAMAEHVLVSGEVVLTMIEAMGFFKKMGVNILAKHGITDPIPKQWYPQQAYLDAYREIYEQIGSKTLKTIGKHIPEQALWPPNIHTIEEALASIDQAYHMNHRGGEIGYYRFQKTGERSGKMICNNPYPCPFDYGIIETTAQKFAPRKMQVKVTHDDTHSCRLKGGETCTYHITW